jgi:hypothetical protein
MANYFNLILDTTAPSSPTISIDGGATFATQQIVNCTISTGDGDTTGYQMLIWGDVDTSYNANIQSVEGSSSWISFSTTQQLKLSSGDGVKTIYVRIRDDVYNSSGQASDTIQLNTAIPTVNCTAVDVTKISKVAGKNVASFSFTSDIAFDEYKVKVVSATNATENLGTVIPTTNGSTNMSATGSFAANSAIVCTINGADLELASSGDGTKIIKVFVKDSSTGSWSV